MSDIEVYMEGGGRTASSRGLLREGAEEFFRELRAVARNAGLELRIVCCGGRGEARARFTAAREEALCSAVLLVDSEVPVESDARSHLLTHDRWVDLTSIPEEEIHLMVQVMETWLVADVRALSEHYGSSFRAELLPTEGNLEAVGKSDIISALERATEETRQGKYHKIHHARALLGRIDPEEVKARCPHCKRLFDTLTSAIEAA